jgi:hypothetical protein
MWEAHAMILNRFSPVFDNMERYAITKIRPLASHIDLFPPGLVDVKKVSYMFEYDSPTLAPSKQYWKKLRDVSAEWIKLHQGFAPIYYYTIGPGFVYITDARYSARARANGKDKGGKPNPEARYLYLEGIAKDILLLADSIQSIRSLKTLLAPLYPSEVADNAVEEAVEEMLEEELLMREGNLLLTLPVGSKARTTDELHDIVFGRRIAGLATGDGPQHEGL